MQLSLIRVDNVLVYESVLEEALFLVGPNGSASSGF